MLGVGRHNPFTASFQDLRRRRVPGAALARLVGVADATGTRWLKGDIAPQPNKYAAIQRAIQELTTESGEIPPVRGDLGKGDVERLRRKILAMLVALSYDELYEVHQTLDHIMRFRQEALTAGREPGGKEGRV